MKRIAQHSKVQKQRGAVAIEFAIIFPVFFVICYAIIAYALAFLAVQNMTYTSEEILRKAIGLNHVDCEELLPKAKTECNIEAAYEQYAHEMLLFSDSSGEPRYSKNTDYCASDLVCTLKIEVDPLIPVSVFGFTLLDLSGANNGKLISRASLLY